MSDAVDRTPVFPPWYADALRAAHLRITDSSPSPGRIQDAAIRALEECLRSLDQPPEDIKRTAWILREFTDLKEARTGRRVLAHILQTISIDQGLEIHRRSAAMLALTVLVVLEDRDPDVLRTASSAEVQVRLETIKCYYVKDGRQEEVTGESSCRHDLAQALDAEVVPSGESVRALAQDVLDGVKPGPDESEFIKEHRDLLSGCINQREGHEGWLGGQFLLRAAGVYSGGSMAYWGDQPVTKWTKAEDPLEAAVGMIVAETLNTGGLPLTVTRRLVAYRKPRSSPEDSWEEVKQRRIDARLSLLDWLLRAVGSDELDDPTKVRLSAAGGGLAAILMAECSALAPLHFLGAVRSHRLATVELRSFLRTVEERLTTADTPPGRLQIASDVWRVSETADICVMEGRSEAGGRTAEDEGRMKGSAAGTSTATGTLTGVGTLPDILGALGYRLSEPPPEPTDQDRTPVQEASADAGDHEPPHFKGPGISFGAAAVIFGLRSESALRKRIKRASENDPLSWLQRGGKGTIPHKERKYLRRTAVEWIAQRWETEVDEMRANIAESKRQQNRQAQAAAGDVTEEEWRHIDGSSQSDRFRT